MKNITFEDFEKVDIRLGEVLECELIPDGRYSTHKLKINFGETLGIKKSCARLVHHKPEDLIGIQILAVVNFPPRQIGKNMSEVLVLGFPDENKETILIHPEKRGIVGTKLF